MSQPQNDFAFAYHLGDYSNIVLAMEGNGLIKTKIYVTRYFQLI